MHSRESVTYTLSYSKNGNFFLLLAGGAGGKASDVSSRKRALIASLRHRWARSATVGGPKPNYLGKKWRGQTRDR